MKNVETSATEAQNQDDNEKCKLSVFEQNSNLNRSRDSLSPPAVARSNRTTMTIPHSMFLDDAKSQKKIASRLSKLKVPKRTESKPKMSLFSHLVQMERDVHIGQNISLGNSSIHPCFVSFGLKCSENMIFSTHSRSVKLIYCLKTFVNDYSAPIPDEYTKDFENSLKPSLSFLSECRPNSSGQATIIKLFKDTFAQTHGMTEIDMKLRMNTFLDEFLNERIFLAGDVISSLISQRINDDDVLLTCSFSEVILNGFLLALSQGKKFKVVVVDYPPRFEGLQLIHLLDSNGVSSIYISLNALSFIMPMVTGIFLPATSLLSNGAVMSNIGTATISNLGFASKIPVLFCCESYNFTERAQTDAFVYNELGDPDDIINPKLAHSEHLKDWKKNPRISLVNLFHDVVQPKYVTAVITELGIIPCTSAPVVLRMKNS